MRILLLSALLLTALAEAGFGQRFRLDRARRALLDQAAVEIGVVGQVNRTDLVASGGDPGRDLAARVRGGGGLFASFAVAGRLRFRPELAATVKAFGASAELFPPCLPEVFCSAVVERQTVQSTWLEAPLLAEWRFARALGRGRPLALLGGPYLAVRLGCRASSQFGTENAVVSIPCAEAGLPVRDGDAGFVLGLRAARRGVGLGVRWTRSLRSAIQDGGGPFGRGRLSTLALTLDLATRLD